MLMASIKEVGRRLAQVMINFSNLKATQVEGALAQTGSGNVMQDLAFLRS